MTTAQTKLYWREWAKAWARLRADDHTLTSADANRARHDLHRRAMGYPRSSRDLDNREFDAVLAALRAVSSPTDISSQRRALMQPRTRLLWKLENEAFASLTEALGGCANRATEYLESLMLDRFHTADPSDLSDPSLRELLMTITQRVKRLRTLTTTP